MKKFKFFALIALFCAMGMNAFAAVDPVKATIGVFKVKYDPTAVEAPALPKATIVGFKNDVTATEIETLTIPATMVDNTNGGVEVEITGVNFKDADNLAENATAIPLVKTINMSGATNLISLSDGAFQGFTALTSITFGAELKKIGIYAFDQTALTTIDLSGTKVATINPLVQTYNDNITTVKLPADLTLIATGAFNNLTTLTTIDWSACTKSITVGGTRAEMDLNENQEAVAPFGAVFDHCYEYTTAEWSAKVKQISADALAGSSIESLTLNSYVNITDPVVTDFPYIQATGATTVKTLIVKGDFGGHFYENAFGAANNSLETVTFQGKVAATAIYSGAFNCPNLATVNFNGELAAGAVLGGAFAGAASALIAELPEITSETASVLTINYPAGTATSPTTPFADNAFSANGIVAGVAWNHAQLITTEAFTAVFAVPNNHSNVATNPIYGLFIESGEPEVVKDLLAVATKEGSSFYYAKLVTEGGQGYKIAKKQGADNHMVVVYSAYVDESDGTIYMNNLRIVNGYYNVPPLTPVIVKSATGADVEMEPDNNIVYPGGLQGDNEIIYSMNGNKTGADLKAEVLDPLNNHADATVENPDYIPYFLAPIADYGFLWSPIANGRILKGVGAANATGAYYNPATKETTIDFYMIVNNVNYVSSAPAVGPVGPAPARVVWLDGSEEDSTTGIDFIKASENTKSGVIYNLAGQKVDSNYKGVIIVNGQKKIQK